MTSLVTREKRPEPEMESASVLPIGSPSPAPVRPSTEMREPKTSRGANLLRKLKAVEARYRYVCARGGNQPLCTWRSYLHPNRTERNVCKDKQLNVKWVKCVQVSDFLFTLLFQFCSENACWCVRVCNAVAVRINSQVEALEKKLCEDINARDQLEA